MLTGTAAITFAKTHTLPLSKFAETTEADPEDVSLTEAEEIVGYTPDFVFLMDDCVRDWIAASADLDTLLFRLRASEDAIGPYLTMRPDWPTWGEAPASLDGVWNYDETRILRYLSTDAAVFGDEPRWVLEVRQ